MEQAREDMDVESDEEEDSLDMMASTSSDENFDVDAK
jgi:hypothetical protein